VNDSFAGFSSCLDCCHTELVSKSHDLETLKRVQGDKQLRNFNAKKNAQGVGRVIKICLREINYKRIIILCFY